MHLIPRIFPELIECGTDEAGRGCLAGPVTAAAVILPPDFIYAGITDSKTLSRKRKNHLREVIEKEALCYAVAHVYQQSIDEINILNASILAMHRAIDGLTIKPEHIAVDGNRFHPYPEVEATTVVKGDSKYLHIAAASILAKTYRDEYMAELDIQHPEYNWSKNQGYPTKEHREAIRKHGITEHHRKSFKLLPN